MVDEVNFTPDMIDNLINMLKNNSGSTNSTNNNEKNSNSSSGPFESMDFETIIKIKSIMEALNNKDDPDSNLLYSLKPYLRKSRQVKLDQYVNILKISKASKFFTQNNKES